MGTRLLVAFDAGSVSGGLFSRGLGGPQVRAFVQAPLAHGALSPTPASDNLVRREEVREALSSVLQSLGTNGRPAVLLLPAGVARLLLLQASGGVTPLEFARFRLGPSLPFPPAEALVDVQPAGGKGFLAAAVRRSVVESYESVAAEAGLERERIDVAPLASLPALMSRSRDAEVHVLLGDTAVCMAVVEGGSVHAFRVRLRDRSEDEGARLAEEIARTRSLASCGPPRAIKVVGPGAQELVVALQRSGLPAEPGWPFEAEGLPVAASEIPWLGSALS